MFLFYNKKNKNWHFELMLINPFVYTLKKINFNCLIQDIFNHFTFIWLAALFIFKP